MECVKFEKAEIIQHNHRNNCWIILFNKVYDITDFIAQHPGGAEILLSRAGEDASSFFQTRHGRNNRLYKSLDRYCIGELCDKDKVEPSAFDEPFLEELVQACQRKNLFKVSKSRKRKFGLIRSALLVGVIMTIVLVHYIQLPWFIAVPLVIIQSFISTSLFGLIAHEHTHHEFPQNKWYRGIIIGLWPVLWPFISRKALIYEHNSHHVKIGDPDYDYEVIGFSHFIRYSGEIEHRKIHKVQHYISWFWYMFYANIITTIGGIFTSFWSNHRKSVALQHNISILVTLSVFVVIPALIHGMWWYHALLYMLFQCVLFSCIYIGAAINHFTPLANEPIPQDMKNKFGYYVCHNTTNFAPESPFWFYFTGGFNIQIEHHLSAFVPVENLKDLQPIVKELCQKYHYPYIEYDSIISLYKAHYNYLYQLSKQLPDKAIYAEIENKRMFQAR